MEPLTAELTFEGLVIMVDFALVIFEAVFCFECPGAVFTSENSVLVMSLEVSRPMAFSLKPLNGSYVSL